jgi:proteasome lid subunit RPN8/RPN11
MIVRIAVAGSQLSHAMATGDMAGADKALSVVRAAIGGLQRQEPVVAPSPSTRGDGRTHFLVDSLFLAGAMKYLLEDPASRKAEVRERFHYVTGIKVDAHTYALTHIVPVGFSQQSAVYLRVEDSSNIAALQSLDRWGTPLVAHFHSHPGRGPHAALPSGIDLRFQERLERGSHITIGAIYSQDGFVRFFAGDESRFVVTVFGKQVKEIERNVYQVELGNETLPVARLGRIVE